MLNFNSEMLDNAGTDLFADQSIDKGVNDWWDNDEHDAEELLDIFRDWGEPLAHNYDCWSDFIKHIHNEVWGAGLEGFAASGAICSAPFNGRMKDSDVGKSNNQENTCAHSPGHGQTWRNKNKIIRVILSVKNHVKPHTHSNDTKHTHVWVTAQTVDVARGDGGGAAGQAQDRSVAAVDMFDGVSTQWDVDVEGEEHADAEHSNEPGESAAWVQPSRRHDGGIPERFTHGDVPEQEGHRRERATENSLFKLNLHVCFMPSACIKNIFIQTKKPH